MAKKDKNIKNEVKNNQEKEEIKKTKSVFEKVLYFDKPTGLLIPEKWIYPYLFRKKDYLAIIIGLNNRFEFERVFLEKEEFETDTLEKRSYGIGFGKENFADNLILEEKFSYKKDKTFIAETSFWKITLLEDGVYGTKISKTEIKDFIRKKQKLIYEEFKELFKIFGEHFCLYIMKSLLKQKQLISKRLNFFS